MSEKNMILVWQETYNMKVIVFTEGGRNYGYGHVSRCKALCEAFIETGVTPDLIINGDEDDNTSA